MKRLKKIIGIILAVSFVITGIPQLGSVRVKAVSTTKEIYPGFIKADGTNLKNEKGETVYLRGVNAGGYMLQEIWLCATYGATDDKSSGNIRCQKNILDTLNSRFGSEKAKILLVHMKTIIGQPVISKIVQNLALIVSDFQFGTEILLMKMATGMTMPLIKLTGLWKQQVDMAYM